jgi:hypothetical protein
MLREMEQDASNPFSFDERKDRIVVELAKHGFVHQVHYSVLAVPNITHITYGRDVGYRIEQEHLGEQVESISATKIRKEMLDNLC